MKAVGSRISGCLALAISLSLSPSAWACAVCTGNPESPLTHGAQKGILTMLIITYIVVIGLIAMFVVTAVRSRQQHGPHPRPGLRCTPTGIECRETG